MHPGWRGRIPAKFHVVADQREALAQIERAIDREMWSPRQRAEWKTMLESMVHTMDWDTGLVIGVTREHLARLTGRSTRSVSRMWAWAQNVGLIVRVEEGASASWLGTSRNRSAAFAFVTDTPGRAAALAASSADEPTAEQVVDQYGNPPASCVEKKPLERPNQKHQPKWPAFRIPETPSQRLAAAKIMVTRAGLDAQSLDQQRLCGLLRAWWADGACVAELLWAIDHHPDSPDHPRGDALRGARDPIAVLGHRLSPWVGRTAELPETLRGRRGDYLAAQARRLADATGLPMASAFVAPSRKDVRAAAQAALRAHLETQRLKRGRLATTHGSR